MADLTKEELKQFTKFQQAELDGVEAYKALAGATDDEYEKEVFLKLAADEGKHAAFFRGFTDKALKPKKAQAFMLSKMFRAAGRKKIFKTVSDAEYAGYDMYTPYLEKFPSIADVREDEKRHGDTMKELLNRALEKEGE